MDRRTKARELAMQAIYQLDVHGGQFLGSLEEFLIENSSDAFVRRLASKLTKGTWENLVQCDEQIADSIIKWRLSRLSSVDKSILRLSAYQLKFCRDIPPKVVINEAIELAKKFSTSQSSGFVNGVLDAILRKLKVENEI